MVTHVNYRLTGQELRWTVTHFALLQAGAVYIDGRKQVLEQGGCQFEVLLPPKVVHHHQRGVLHMGTITCHQQIHVGLSAHCQVFTSVLQVRALVSVCHLMNCMSARGASCTWDPSHVNCHHVQLTEKDGKVVFEKSHQQMRGVLSSHCQCGTSLLTVIYQVKCNLSQEASGACSAGQLHP